MQMLNFSYAFIRIYVCTQWSPYIPLTGVVVGGVIRGVMRLPPLPPVRTGGHGGVIASSLGLMVIARRV